MIFTKALHILYLSTFYAQYVDKPEAFAIVRRLPEKESMAVLLPISMLS